MAAQTNFIDIATIWLHAGKGGDGAVSFHREKFVAAGGPDGGDGGRGGDIVFVVDDHLSTLMDFRYKRKYTAEAGGNGRGSNCHGANAPDLVIKVPMGTVIKDTASGLVDLLYQISRAGTTVVMATHNLALPGKYPGRIIRCEAEHLTEISTTAYGQE